MAEIKYYIEKEIGVVSETTKGWTKELNLISWNGKTAKYDLRDWAPEHEKMGKEQERTTDHRHTVLHDHSLAFAVRVHLSSLWRDGKIQFL